MRRCAITILLSSVTVLTMTGVAFAAAPKSKPKPREEPRSQGIYPRAETGLWCVTGPSAIVTMTRYARAEVSQIIASGDHAAYQKLFQDRKAAMLNPGLHVFVMDVDWPYAKIRLEGQPEGMWTDAMSLEQCRDKPSP